jgi:hypothetical protein
MVGVGCRAEGFCSATWASGLARQAKVIDFFLGGSPDPWLVGWVGSPPNRSLGPIWSWSWMRNGVGISGGGGLGVSALDGLVRPVSLVRSTVDVRLILLVIERRRWRASTLGLGSTPTSSSGRHWRALVNNDEWRSECFRTLVFRKSPGASLCLLRHESGGSSTSAPASSSTIGGTLVDCEDHVMALEADDVCRSGSIAQVYETQGSGYGCAGSETVAKRWA